MYRQRTSEQALRVDRPPSALSFATCGSLPATQGQRSCRWRGKSTQLDLRGRGIGFDDARYSLRTRQIWPY